MAEPSPRSGDPEAGRLRTERRRLVQPVWSALDRSLAPALPGGLLLAVSYGRDSAVLLEAAARWPGREQGAIEVASVDHGHRPGAPAEVDAVCARARVLGFEAEPLVGAARPGAGEGELRRIRYGALAAHAELRGLEAVVTAHHATDDAEGLVLSLLGQGGGRGGAAMDQERALGSVRLLRPFLDLTRAQLDLAATGLGLDRRLVDPADRRGQGARAGLRGQLWPALRRHRPDIDRRLSTEARRRSDDEAALQRWAERLAVEPLEEGGLAILGGPEVPAPVWRRAVAGACRELSAADPRRAWATLQALSEAAALGRAGSFDLAGVRAEVGIEGVTLRPRGGSAGPDREGRK